MKTKNQKICLRLFSKEYWQLALEELKFVKTIAMVSILIAFDIALNLIGTIFPIKVFTRQIMFTFIPTAISSFLFGPVVAIAYGIISDVLGYFIGGGAGGEFFPGYTLSAVLGALIYSVFLYRTRISMFKIFISKFFVNIFVNAYLGSVWLSILYSKKTFYAYLIGGITKNLILLPIEVFILIIVFKKIIPISKNYDFLSQKVSNEIKII